MVINDPVSDPVADVMSDRIEEALRDRLLSRREWLEIQCCYRGEPGIVPVRLYPFAVVFLTNEGEALGEDGYTRDTGPISSNRYDGFITVNVLVSGEAAAYVPDENRKADVKSYIYAKKFIQAAKQELLLWAREFSEGGEVRSSDGRESTSQLRLDRIQNAITVRQNETVSNIATLPFHLFTRRQEF